MPPTTKGSPNTSLAGVSQNSGSGSHPSPRSNPVCLDVPVVIRSLPVEKGGSLFESEAPLEEQSRTVIVFDNGAVLRVSRELPVDQDVVVSNAQGREAVCRLARTRNLPSVKEFVEIEFLESAGDFWGINQTSPHTNASDPPPRALPSEPEPGRAGLAASASQPAASGVKEPSLPAGGAPSFDDIAGVVAMSADPGETEQAMQPVPQAATPNAPAAQEGKLHEERRPQEEPHEEKREQTRNESAKPVAAANPPRPAIRAPASLVKDAGRADKRSSAPPRQIDFLGKTILGSSQVPPFSTAKKSRGKAAALIVACILILAAIAAGYLFLYRGGIAGFKVKVPAAAPLPAVTLPPAPDANQKGKTPPSVDETKPITLRPIADIQEITVEETPVR